MVKKTSLGDALAIAAHGSGSAKLPAAAETQSGARSAGTKARRVGRVNVTGYFDPAVKQSIRLIQAKHPDRTTQDLLCRGAQRPCFQNTNVPQTADIQK